MTIEAKQLAVIPRWINLPLLQVSTELPSIHSPYLRLLIGATATPIEKLPNEIQRLVIIELDVASRISLGLAIPAFHSHLKSLHPEKIRLHHLECIEPNCNPYNGHKFEAGDLVTNWKGFRGYCTDIRGGSESFSANKLIPPQGVLRSCGTGMGNIGIILSNASKWKGWALKSGWSCQVRMVSEPSGTKL